ncbi:molybdenum cofactor biosynthesis protein MoaE [Pseudahrensia aquimaris]|uniref:Molybdopterin synthase catalytic subunit n=1 Tax=Pseudahrensia aquimaris TaxID=744461 RepID=A0ABW3FDN1_9HYPH
MESRIPTIKVQTADFNVAAEIEKLTHGRTDIGAVVNFVGLCRSEDDTLEALELEHYPGMAVKQLEALAREATDRWPLDGVTIIHRHGRIEPGQQIVLVVATSMHRDAAFEGARFMMDYLKTDAPFWKKEHKVGQTDGSWVDAHDADLMARQRWAS